MPKILIDYFGGAHGHFLEYILNSLDSDSDELLDSDPWSKSDLGTCRHRIYEPWSLRFCADHYSTEYYKKFDNRIVDVDNAKDYIIISFQKDFSDWMLFLEVQFYRAHPWGTSPGLIEDIYIDTEKKLSKTNYYKNFLDKLKTNYKQRDGIEKWSLRMLFLDEFMRDPEKTPMFQLHVLPWFKEKNLYEFEFTSFYNTDSFMAKITEFSKIFNLLLNEDRVEKIKNKHKLFLSKNPYATRNSYERCKTILNGLDTDLEINNLNLLEESFLCKEIEKLTNTRFYSEENSFFSSTKEIRRYIENCINK